MGRVARASSPFVPESHLALLAWKTAPQNMSAFLCSFPAMRTSMQCYEDGSGRLSHASCTSITAHEDFATLFDLPWALPAAVVAARKERAAILRIRSTAILASAQTTTSQ